MSKANFEWVILGDLAVSCTSRGDMPNERWNEYLKELRAYRVSKVLGTAVGSLSLTSAQRKQASEVMEELNITSAGVTDESIVRGFVTALSWVGVNIKAFSWAELRQAIAYLQVPPSVAERAFQAAHELRVRVHGEVGSKTV
jgi:hypothetical protein